jgi:hypothetical protein
VEAQNSIERSLAKKFRATKLQGTIKVLLPTDAQENYFKWSIKIYIKTAPTCVGVITITRECTI